MSNYHDHNQFRPLFRVQSLPGEENDVRAGTLLARESDARTGLAYPPVTIRSLPGSLPPQFPARSFSAQNLGSWRNPLTPLPLTRRAFLPYTWNRRSKIIVIISGVFLLAIIVCFMWVSMNTGTPDVTLYQVSEHNVTQYSGGGGMVFPRQQFTLSYPVAEYAVNVLVKAGDQVTSKQPLLQLDPTRLDAQIKQLSDDVAAAQAYLNGVSASGNAASLAQAQQQYTLIKSKYNALVAESSSLLLHDGNLISPMNGVVTTVNINAGEVFAADAPLLIIMDESTVIVHVKVPLTSLSLVHTGQQAVVTPSALPDLNFQGTINAIVPQADPQTDTFEVWVSVPNPHKTLLAGMSAFVRIQTPERAIVIPRLAVLNSSYEPVTFIVRNQYAYLHPVQILTLVEDQFLVRSGLNVGDRVVLVGLDALRDDQRVHVSSIETGVN